MGAWRWRRGEGSVRFGGPPDAAGSVISVLWCIALTCLALQFTAWMALAALLRLSRPGG
jgi:hypothetical protein